MPAMTVLPQRQVFAMAASAAICRPRCSGQLTVYPAGEERKVAPQVRQVLVLVIFPVPFVVRPAHLRKRVTPRVYFPSGCRIGCG